MSRHNVFNSIAKSAAILSLLTIFIKAIGFVKQSVISYYFGASSDMDAYLVVTDFVSEVGVMFFSSIAIAFISIYEEERHDKNSVNGLISNTFTGLTTFSVVIVVVICIFARYILMILAPGFSSEMLDFSSSKLRMVSFLLINICVSNICIAILNAEKRFVVAKSIGLIQSVCIIVACVFFGKKIGINALYYGFIAYYLIENIFLLNKLKHSFSYNLNNPLRDRRVIKLLKLSLPLFISSAVIQINAMIDKAIASGLVVGSVSGMSYGSFVFNTIHSVIIASVTTVLYSYYSTYVVEKNEVAIVQKTKISIHILIAMLAPICIFCCIFSQDIVRIIYGRGSFGTEAVALTSRAFLGYSIGIVFIAIRDVYLQVLYAYQKTRIAMINGAIGVMINIVLSIVLSKYTGVFGIALADSIAYLVLVIISYYSVRNLVPGISSVLSVRDYISIGFACGVAFFSGIAGNGFLSKNNVFVRVFAGGVIVLGAYYLIIVLLKHESVQYIRGYIKNRG